MRMPIPAATGRKTRAIVKKMMASESVPDFPDEVPVADAVEQTRAAVDSDDDLAPGGSDDDAPLESNESDWQEQREIVEGFDEDEFR